MYIYSEKGRYAGPAGGLLGGSIDPLPLQEQVFYVSLINGAAAAGDEQSRSCNTAATA